MKCLICDKSSEIHCAMIVVMKKDARIVIHIKPNFKSIKIIKYIVHV